MQEEDGGIYDFSPSVLREWKDPCQTFILNPEYPELYPKVSKLEIRDIKLYPSDRHPCGPLQLILSFAHMSRIQTLLLGNSDADMESIIWA